MNAVHSALAKQLDYKEGREIATYQVRDTNKEKFTRKQAGKQARNEHMKYGDTKEKQKLN